MGRDWKPGDVAIANESVMLRTGNGWLFASGGSWSHAEPGRHITEVARPLVVIDPEDREQVERLIRLQDKHFNDGSRETVHSDDLRDMSAALREFANPTPPKPDEPTAMWSVVVDDRDDHWVRALGPDFMDGWVRAGDLPSNGKWTDYRHINVVRVLSEGVTP